MSGVNRLYLLFAGEYGGLFYTSTAPTASTMELAGTQGSTVFLLYSAPDTFQVLERFGPLYAY
jgi:hypothetical protein